MNAYNAAYIAIFISALRKMLGKAISTRPRGRIRDASNVNECPHDVVIACADTYQQAAVCECRSRAVAEEVREDLVQALRGAAVSIRVKKTSFALGCPYSTYGVISCIAHRTGGNVLPEAVLDGAREALARWSE